MDRLNVLAMFSWQYLLMAFLACLGIVQMAAARSGKQHLWLLRGRRRTALFGVLLVATGMLLFYLTPLLLNGPWGPPDLVDGTPTWARASPDRLAGARNINDTDGGLSGHWQALWFAIGWIAAVFFARTMRRALGPIHVQNRPDQQEQQPLVGVR